MEELRQELSLAQERIHSLDNGGKIVDVSTRQAARKTAKVTDNVKVALEFLGTFGVTPDSLRIHTDAGRNIILQLSGTLAPGSYDGDMHLKVLQLLDKFGVSDSFYHELAMLCPELPRSNYIKTARNALNQTLQMHRMEGYDGTYHSLEGSLCDELHRLVCIIFANAVH